MTQVNWDTFFSAVQNSIGAESRLVIIETSDRALTNRLAPNSPQYHHSEAHPAWLALLEHAAEQIDSGAVISLRSRASLYPRVLPRELAKIANSDDTNNILWLCAVDDQTIPAQAEAFFGHAPNWKLRFCVTRAVHPEAIRPADSDSVTAFRNCLRRYLQMPDLPLKGTSEGTGENANTPFIEMIERAITFGTRCDTLLTNRLLDALNSDPSTSVPPQLPTIPAAAADIARQIWLSNVIKKIIRFLHPNLVRWAEDHDLLNDFYFACARIANSDVSGPAPIWYASELLPKSLRTELEKPNFRAWLRRFANFWNPPSPLTLSPDSPPILAFLLNLQGCLKYRSAGASEWSLTEGYRHRAKLQISKIMKLLSETTLQNLRPLSDASVSRADIRERLMLLRCLMPVARFCKIEAQKLGYRGTAVTQLATISKVLKVQLAKLRAFDWTGRLNLMQLAAQKVHSEQTNLRAFIVENSSNDVLAQALAELDKHLQSNKGCELRLKEITDVLAKWQMELENVNPVPAEPLHTTKKLNELLAISKVAFEPCNALLESVHDKLTEFPSQLSAAMKAMAEKQEALNLLLGTTIAEWSKIQLDAENRTSFLQLLQAEEKNEKRRQKLKLDAVLKKLENALVGVEIDDLPQFKKAGGPAMRALHATEVLLKMMDQTTVEFALEPGKFKELLTYIDLELGTLDKEITLQKQNANTLLTPALDALQIELLLLHQQLVKIKRERNDQSQHEVSTSQINRLLDDLEKTQIAYPAIPVERVKLLRAEAHESKDRYDAAIECYQAISSDCDYLLDPVLWRLAYYGELRCRMSARSLPEYAVLSRLLAFADVQDLRSQGLDNYGKGGDFIIFPSFRSSIREQVGELCKGVRSENDGGLSLFIDHDRNEAEDFDPVIYERLLSADIAIVFITEDYFTSPWCVAELTLLLQQNRFRGTKLYYVEVDTHARAGSSINTQFEGFNNDRLSRLRTYGEKLIPEIVSRTTLSNKLRTPLTNLIKAPRN